MGSLAEAMTKVAQEIQFASERRGTRLSEVRSELNGLLGNFRAAQREMTRELKETLAAAEKARGVQVSELRSDSHNLLQRFALEHRDMGQALRDGLASETSARVAAVLSGTCTTARWWTGSAAGCTATGTHHDGSDLR